MNRIIKSTEYNQSYSRGKKEVAAAAEAMVDIRRGGGRQMTGELRQVNMTKMITTMITTASLRQSLQQV